MISLFAGAGGLDLGLEAAGFACLAASELQPHATSTLLANRQLGQMDRSDFEGWFSEQLQQRCHRTAGADAVAALRDRLMAGMGHHEFLSQAEIVTGDIRGISSAELADAAGVAPGEVTLVAGGPPCQPFSRAGKRATVDDPGDGQLFMEFVRVVDDLRPRWLLFENVKGLAQSKTTVWRSRCEECGADHLPPFDPSRTAPDEGDAAPRCACGSARTRWRIEERAPGGSLELILAEFERIGYRCDWRILNAADHGAPQVRERLIIAGSRDGEKPPWPEPTHQREATGSDQLPLEGSPPWRTMWDELWPEGRSRLGRLDVDRAVLWVKNVVRPHDEPVTWRLDRPAPTVGAHQAAKFALAPRGVPKAQLMRQQWHVLGRRQGDTPPVDVEHAYLSDEELLALQTFPRYWYLFGTRMQRAFQVGNAVPPALAQALGQALLGTASSARKPVLPLAA